MAKNNAHRLAAVKTILSNAVLNSVANPHITKFMEIGGRLERAIEALRALDVNANPSESDSSHNTRLSVAAGKLNARIADLEVQLSRILKSEQSDIDERIAEKVNLIPNAEAAELRTVFRSMPIEKQLELLKQLAMNNDGPAIAAICCCLNVLSGITPDIQAFYKSHIVSLHAPREYADSKALLDALQPFLTVANVAKDFAADYAEPGYSNPQRDALIARESAAKLAAFAAIEEFEKAAAVNGAPEFVSTV